MTFEMRQYSDLFGYKVLYEKNMREFAGCKWLISNWNWTISAETSTYLTLGEHYDFIGALLCSNDPFRRQVIFQYVGQSMSSFIVFLKLMFSDKTKFVWLGGGGAGVKNMGFSFKF